MEDNEEWTCVILTFPRFCHGTIRSEPGKDLRRLSCLFWARMGIGNSLDKVYLAFFFLTASSATVPQFYASTQPYSISLNASLYLPRILLIWNGHVK